MGLFPWVIQKATQPPGPYEGRRKTGGGEEKWSEIPSPPKDRGRAQLGNMGASRARKVRKGRFPGSQKDWRPTDSWTLAHGGP